MPYTKIKPSEWYKAITGNPIFSRTGCSTFLQAASSLETGGKGFWAFAPDMPQNIETARHVIRNYFTPLSLKLMQRLMYINHAQTSRTNLAGGGFDTSILTVAGEMGIGFLACTLNWGRDHQWWDPDIQIDTGGFPENPDYENPTRIPVIHSWMQNFDGAGWAIDGQAPAGVYPEPPSQFRNTFYNECIAHQKCKITGTTTTDTVGAEEKKLRVIFVCSECPLWWSKYAGYPNNTELPGGPGYLASATILDHPHVLEQWKADWTEAYSRYGIYPAWLGWIGYMEFPETPWFNTGCHFAPYSLWKYTYSPEFAEEVETNSASPNYGRHFSNNTPCTLMELRNLAGNHSDPEHWVATWEEQQRIPTWYADVKAYHWVGGLVTERDYAHYLMRNVASHIKNLMDWWNAYTDRPWIWEMEAPKTKIHVEVDGEKYFNEYFGGTVIGGQPFCGTILPNRCYFWKPGQGDSYEPKALVLGPRLPFWTLIGETKHIMYRAGCGVFPWGSWGNFTDNFGAVNPFEIRLLYLMFYPITSNALVIWDMMSRTFAGPDRWICANTTGYYGLTADNMVQYPYRFGNLLNRMRYYGGPFGLESQRCRVLALGGSETGFTSIFFTSALDIVMERTGLPEHGTEKITNIRFPTVSTGEFDVIVIWSGPSISTDELQNKIVNFVNQGGGIVFVGAVPSWFQSKRPTTINPIPKVPHTHPIWEPFDSLTAFGGSVSIDSSGKVIQVSGTPAFTRIGTSGRDDTTLYEYGESSYPPGGRPRDSAIVLITNAILYAGGKLSRIPAFYYDTIYSAMHWGGERNPGRDIYYGIAGGLGNPLVWFSNATGTDEYGVNLHLNASFFGVDPTEWILVDVANWSFARGSGEDIHINPQPLPAWSWMPIYIRNLPSDRCCVYTNAFIEKVIEDHIGNFSIPAPMEMPVWVVIYSRDAPTGVKVNGEELPRGTLLSLADPTRRDFDGRQVGDDPNVPIDSGIVQDYTFSEGWTYDVANEMLVIKFVSAGTNTINVKYEEGIFSTGFETGDLNLEQFERRIVDRGTLNIVASPPHHGEFVLKAATTYRFGNAMAVKQLPPGKQVVYVGAYVLFETMPDVTNPTTPGYANMYPIYIRHYDAARTAKPTIQYAGVFAYHKQGEPVRWALNYGTNAGEGSYAPVAQTGPALKQWYFVEVMVKRGAGDGEIIVWVDGQETIRVSNLSNDALAGYSTPDINSVWVGLGEGPGTHFVDCFKIADFYLEPEPEGRLEFVTEPAGASIEIDDYNFGVTPTTKKLAPGSHKIYFPPMG